MRLIIFKMNKSILHNFIFLFCATSLLFSQSNQLIWSDEFDGQPGPINSQRWFHQTTLPNGYSWWNGEIQHYTNRSENAYVSNGTLKIVAKKEIFPGDIFSANNLIESIL